MGLFGNSSSSGAGPSSQLPPTPYPVGGASRFRTRSTDATAIPTCARSLDEPADGADCTHTSEIVLKLTEKRLSWTGDDFDIKDVAGRSKQRRRS